MKGSQTINTTTFQLQREAEEQAAINMAQSITFIRDSLVGEEEISDSLKTYIDQCYIGLKKLKEQTDDLERIQEPILHPTG
jgi:hypothetical protein